MGGSEGIQRIERLIEYASLPSQKTFHALTERFKGFSGPIGSGKSKALCQEALRLSYINPGRMGLIGAPTYPMLRDVTQVAFLEILRDNHIPYDLNRTTQTLRMQDTGSHILFRSVGDAEHLRGTNLAWFGIDELSYTREEAWMRLEGRLRDPKATRLSGFAAWTPKGHDWVYKRFLGEPVDGYKAVVAKAYENRYILANTPDFYERLKKSYDPEFFKQEVLGEYLNSNNHRVYRQFERKLHLRPMCARDNQRLYWALDFNVDPMCSVVAQCDGDVLHVLDEIVLRRVSTAEACQEFYRRFGDRKRDLVIYGDASGHHQKTTGVSDYQAIREFFRNLPISVTMQTARKNPAVRDRLGLVNARLRDAEDETRLWIDPRCKELIKDLEEVSYRGDSGEIDKEKDRNRTHLSDALGYLVWELYGPNLKIGEKSRRLI